MSVQVSVKAPFSKYWNWVYLSNSMILIIIAKFSKMKLGHKKNLFNRRFFFIQKSVFPKNCYDKFQIFSKLDWVRLRFCQQRLQLNPNIHTLLPIYLNIGSQLCWIDCKLGPRIILKLLIYDENFHKLILGDGSK